MTQLIDLALKDTTANLNRSSSSQYQVKHYFDSTLRGLQEECVTLNNVIAMLKANETDNAKALEKLEKAVEVNRARYTETVKTANQLETAIDSLNRASTWITALTDELKA
jgi:uncharacterized iron-regulated protein